VLELPAYDDAVTALEAGTTVLMYTDGLVERPDMPLDQGLERLIQSLGGDPPQPDRLCRDLLRSLFPSAGPRDDVALLVAQLDSEPEAEGDLKLDLRAESGSLALMRRSVARWLRAVGASEAETYEVLVACGEACANAIAHAYPAAEASFEVHLTRQAHAVVATVRDFGRWRPPRAGTQGRGLGLMRELMDEVEIEQLDVGTAVRMVRRLAGNGQ
jgi:anti-sigma regulatory factor (Ser/Thr protein kinase)